MRLHAVLQGDTRGHKESPVKSLQRGQQLPGWAMGKERRALSSTVQNTPVAASQPLTDCYADIVVRGAHAVLKVRRTTRRDTDSHLWCNGRDQPDSVGGAGNEIVTVSPGSL